MTSDSMEPEDAKEAFQLVEVEPRLLASVVGLPVDQFPDPVFEFDQEVEELIRWVRSGREKDLG